MCPARLITVTEIYKKVMCENDCLNFTQTSYLSVSVIVPFTDNLEPVCSAEGVRNSFSNTLGIGCVGWLWTLGLVLALRVGLEGGRSGLLLTGGTCTCGGAGLTLSVCKSLSLNPFQVPPPPRPFRSMPSLVLVHQLTASSVFS